MRSLLDYLEYIDSLISIVIFRFTIELAYWVIACNAHNKRNKSKEIDTSGIKLNVSTQGQRRWCWCCSKKKRGYTNKLNIISIKNCLVNSFNSLNHRIKKWLKHSIYLAAMQSFPIQKKVNFKTEQKKLYTSLQKWISFNTSRIIVYRKLHGHFTCFSFGYPLNLNMWHLHGISTYSWFISLLVLTVETPYGRSFVLKIGQFVVSISTWLKIL